MKPWQWLGIVAVAVLLGVAAWASYWRPAHPAARVPVFTAPGVMIQFAQVGHYEQEDVLRFALNAPGILRAFAVLHRARSREIAVARVRVQALELPDSDNDERAEPEGQGE